MPAEELPVTMEQDAWDWIVDMGRAALLTVAGVVVVAALAVMAGYLVAR